MSPLLLADIGTMPSLISIAKLDDAMNTQPWLPRAVPYLVYVTLITLVVAASGYQPWLYPIVYTLQCVIVAMLLWRYRHLTPELTVRFHWLAIPFGVVVAVLWVVIGQWMVATWPDQFASTERHLFDEMSPPVRIASLCLRVFGMSLLVPLFEEMFIRSLLLRALHNGRLVMIGLFQLACDLPLIGDHLIHTDMAERAQTHGPVFEKMFLQTPLGQLSVFGVGASTVLFTLGHGMRDWPAAILCGVLYCVLLRLTAHKGLGPVVWAHGLTNLLLFIYCVQTGDWQFL